MIEVMEESADRKKAWAQNAATTMVESLDSLNGSVEELLAAARMGQVGIVEVMARKLVERSLIAGYRHGESAYVIWGEIFSKKQHGK